MIGKTIICFFKRNILYFLGQNQYFFQHLPQKRMCVYVQRLGGGMGHRNNKGASGWPRRAATPSAQEWRGGVGMGSCVVTGFLLQLTIPPLPRVLFFYKISASCKHELNYNPFER